MDWNSEVFKKFKCIIEDIPDDFKAIALQMIKLKAEEITESRKRNIVEEVDMMNALLTVTPNSFRPLMFESVKKVGIILENYTEIEEVSEAWKEVPNYLHKDTLHLLWQLTDRCNSRCIHCRVDSKRTKPIDEESTESIFSMIDNIIDSWDHPTKKIVFNFTGGEPLLRKDIWDILYYAKERAEPKGHMIAFASNGYLINDKIAEKLRDHGVGLIFISLDSMNPDINDQIRGRKGSFELQKHAIEACNKAGILVIISCTVMKHNFDSFIGIKEYAEKLGVFYYFTGIIRVGRAHENWESIGLTDKQYEKLYHIKFGDIIQDIRKGEAEKIPLMSCFDMVPFMEIPASIKDREFLEWGVGCQSCRCVMGIGIHGEVYPCEFITQTVLGNLKKQSFKEIYNSEMASILREHRDRHGKCGECEHLDLCGGGCILHTETMTGDILGSLPYCWHDPEDHNHFNVKNF
ncbi:MAG: radical SAM protein [Candidatus Hermodarchaeota archaeon]